jgi:hypothetical protein
MKPNGTFSKNMKYLCALAAVAALLGGPAYAACPYPAPPHQIPDGRTATLQEMRDGQKAVDDYNAAIDVYVKCLDAESDEAIAKAGDQLTDQQKDERRRITLQRHNAAIYQRSEIGARFTEQMRIFSAKEKERTG